MSYYRKRAGSYPWQLCTAKDFSRAKREATMKLDTFGGEILCVGVRDEPGAPIRTLAVRRAGMWFDS